MDKYIIEFQEKQAAADAERRRERKETNRYRLGLLVAIVSLVVSVIALKQANSISQSEFDKLKLEQQQVNATLQKKIERLINEQNSERQKTGK